MKGLTKQVEVKAEYNGIAKDKQGDLKAEFEVTGIINRKDFGFISNSWTGTGGLVLGEEIKLTANIQVTNEKNS